MTLRLSGGVLPGPDRRIWILGPEGRPTHATGVDLAPGTPVAVGPRSAGPQVAAEALAALTRLVRAGGTVLADVGADLGEGFFSARIEGGAGDRRDAVLAALAVPSIGDRLGEPLALLVALFGPSATKPVGAAARAAIDDGRWAALRFAAAASDVLGPEQLAQLLTLRAPGGVDPFPEGLASVVGAHLARVLGPVHRPRRLELLTDLWQQVCADGSARLRRERLRGSQGRQDRTGDLLARYRQFEHDEVLERLRSEVGGEPTLVQAALWRPSAGFWWTRRSRVLSDAMGATVLARVAVAAADHGLDVALARHRHEIEAAAALLSNREAGDSARVVPGFTGLPARPGSYLRDIRGRVRPGEPLDPRAMQYVTQRLALARDYGIAVMHAVRAFVEQTVDDAPWTREYHGTWAESGLTQWREQVGFFSPDRLADWRQPPLLAGTDPDSDEAGRAPTLTERLQAEPDRPPADVETIGDLFWYAELADALAQLHGHPRAEISPHPYTPLYAPATDLDPPPPDQPLVPRLESVALAVAGTAQLADLGGQVPRRCRTWTELTTGLLGDAAVAAALTGTFDVPPEAAEADGTIMPGTDARIEIARNRRQLADWSDYMGNCIAGFDYGDLAAAGRAVLVALRAPDGRVMINADLRPTTGGWRLAEIRGRYNQDPDVELLRRTREWANGLVNQDSPTAIPTVEPAPEPQPRTSRPKPGTRAVRDLGGPLGDLTSATLAEPETVRAVEVLATLAARLSRSTVPADPHDALTALRRATPAGLQRACQLALADPTGPGLHELWGATADRPLARAVAAMAPSAAERLGPLLVDAPLLGSMRALARLPRVAPARTATLMALRVRGAIGGLLRQDAPELARAVHARPYGPLIRAAAVTVTSWGGLAPAGERPAGPPVGAVTVVTQRRRVRVPGYPASSLRDELWQGAFADAVELGAAPEAFWAQIAAHGLLMPSSWLRGGWATLWARAAGRRP